MNCPECGIAATLLGESAAARMYRCPRMHVFRVPAPRPSPVPERARDEAIARVDESHDLWIERIALPAIRRLRGSFTTDDAWKAIGDVTPPEPRAMGAAMMRAKKAGWIVPTAEYRKSERAACHARPIRVWRRSA